MTVVDLTGMAITELATNAGIMAIAGTKVHPEWAAGEEPPAVIVEQLAIDYSPFGQTRRARLQAPLFAAKTYGATRVQAAQLANAVVEAMELRRPRMAGGKLVYLSLVDSGGDVVLDPDTKWPYGTVIFRLIGSQRAVA
jgi:hypothetical protein